MSDQRRISRRIRGKKIVLLFLPILIGIFYFMHLKFYENQMMKIRGNMAQRRYRDSLSQINRLRLLPFSETEELIYHRGESLLMTGKPDEAFTTWRQIRQKSEYYPRSILKITEWLENQGRLTESEVEYRLALSSKNTNLIEI